MEEKLTIQEKQVLYLFYNRFYDLYEEIVDENFYNIDANIRFYKLKEVFSIYKELTNYEPIKKYLEWAKKGGKPPLQGVIADDLFSFIRNLTLHFPLFNTWDEVYINKNLATWCKVGQIDRFLKKCTKIKIDGKGKLDYRMFEKKKKLMTYFSINFPEIYDNNNIYLKDIITEGIGMKFCLTLMRDVLDKQVINHSEPDIIIMSQVLIPKTK